MQVSCTHQRLDTYVSANQSSTQGLKPAGSGLELLPLSHPTELLAGDTSRFRVLLGGKPLANQQVAVVPGGVRHRGVLKDFAVTSDSQGEFSGSTLLALADEDFSDPLTVREARSLTRQLLADCLGSTPLATRELMQHLAGLAAPSTVRPI